MLGWLSCCRIRLNCLFIILGERVDNVPHTNSPTLLGFFSQHKSAALVAISCFLSLSSSSSSAGLFLSLPCHSLSCPPCFFSLFLRLFLWLHSCCFYFLLSASLWFPLPLSSDLFSVLLLHLTFPAKYPASCPLFLGSLSTSLGCSSGKICCCRFSRFLSPPQKSINNFSQALKGKYYYSKHAPRQNKLLLQRLRL